MAFILATPHSSAFLSPGVPVTREPTSSLNSVRYSNACESIIPSPAIFTSAGFVPSSSGPLGAGRLSALAVHAPPKQNPNAITVTPTNTPRICSLLAPLAQSNSITHSDAPPPFGFFGLSTLASSEFAISNHIPSRTSILKIANSSLPLLWELCASAFRFSSFFANSTFRTVHIQQHFSTCLFTHFPPRPTLPASPSC